MFIPKKYLTETVILLENTDFSSTIRTLTQSNPPNDDDPNFEYYKQLANWANNGRRQYKDGISLEKSNTKIQISDRSLIDKEPRKLETFYGSFHGLLDRLNILMQKEGKFGQNAELSKLIQQTTVEILASLSGIKNPKKSDQEPDPEDPEPPEEDPEDKESDQKLGKGRDWTAYRAKKLASGKPASDALKEFYDEYYSIEYAGVESPEKDTKGIVAKLKSLDKILIPEFNKLGYNPEVNPFAQFLKILIKLKTSGSKIFDKLTINNYGAIHNSFIDKHITGNMLGNHRDDGKGDNLLFCEDLYNYSGLTIVNYLSLQKQVMDVAKDKYPEVEHIVARMLIQQKQFSDDYVANAKALIEAKDGEIVLVEDGKLRSDLEIRELYNHVFGAEAKKTLSKDAIEEIAIATKKNKAILEMVKYLLDVVQLRAVKTPNGYKDFKKWLEQETENYKFDGLRADWSKKVLNRYSLDELGSIMQLVSKLTIQYKNKEKADT